MVCAPAVAAAAIITPFELAGSTDITDAKVVNILRLLQSLDQDGDVYNGVAITEIMSDGDYFSWHEISLCIKKIV